MKVPGKKIERRVKNDSGLEMSVEISETLVEKIKEEYCIDELEDVHIRAFFRDVLHDASYNLTKEEV